MRAFIKIIRYVFLAVIFMILFVHALPQKNIFKTQENLYILDTARSRVNWRNYHNGFIKFNDGYIRLEKGIASTAEFNVNMNSIQDLDIENKLLKGTLNNVLKSADFFNVGVFPDASFELHQIQRIKDDRFKISGDIIVFDNAICYDFYGSIKSRNDSLYFDTDYITIDRTDWGIFYLSAQNPNPKDEEESYVVGDSIRLDVHIVAYNKKEFNK